MLSRVKDKLKSIFKEKHKRYIDVKDKIKKLYNLIDKIDIEENDTHITIKINSDKPIGILHKKSLVIGSERHIILLGTHSIQLNPILNTHDIKTIDGINKNLNLVIKLSDINVKLNKPHPLSTGIIKNECKCNHKG